MRKNPKLKVVCLPVAGIADPGQLLMIQGLNRSGKIIAFTGVHDRFFGIIRSAIIYNPDIIHFDWIESYYIRRNMIYTYINLPFFFMQILTCRYLLRIRLVWTIHNILPHKRNNIRLKYFVLRSFSHIVNYIRVLSNDSINDFASKFKINKKKIHFVGTGDFTGYYPNSISRSEARKKLGIPENAIVILTLGSIKRYKGIPEYLRLMKKVENSEIYILIAGKCIDEKLEGEIRNLTDNRIYFVNKFIDIEELQIYYNSADLVALPFIAIENSGSVVMAMGFKKPIIAPRSNVLNDRLKYQSEFLYERNHLFDVMLRAINTSQELIKTMGEKNYLQLKEYSWEDFGEFLIEQEKVKED